MALAAFDWLNSRHEYVTEDRFLYTRLLSMFARTPGGLNQAMAMFDRMQSAGIKPDTVAFNCAIGAAGGYLNRHRGGYRHYYYFYTCSSHKKD